MSFRTLFTQISATGCIGISTLGLCVSTTVLAQPLPQPVRTSRPTLQISLEPPTGPRFSQHNGPTLTLDNFSRKLLEAAALATNEIRDSGEKAQRLLELSNSYTTFGQPDIAMELKIQALTNALQVSERVQRAALITNTVIAIGYTLPIETIEDRIEELLAPIENELTEEEIQQIKIKAIAFSHTKAGQYRQAYDIAEEIEDFGEREFTRQVILSSAIGETALRESSNSSRRVSAFLEPEAFLDSIENEDPDDIPLPSPREQLIELQLNYYNSDDAESLEENIAQRIELIPRLESASERANEYVQISQLLVHNQQPEQALPFVEKALAEHNIDSQIHANDSHHHYWRQQQDSRLVTLGGLFITVGSVNQGYALIRGIENSQSLIADKVSALIEAAYHTSASDSKHLAEALISEAEQLTQLIELNESGVENLLDIAYRHIQFDGLERARELSNTLIALYDSGELLALDIDTDDFFFRWVYILEAIGDYDRAIEIAIASENEEALIGFPALLVAERNDQQAMEALGVITSPGIRAEALTSMALAYLELNQPDMAFQIMVQALEEAQIADYETYSSDDQWPTTTSVTLGWHSETAGLEQSQRLIEQIENIDTRIILTLNLLPLESSLEMIQSEFTLSALSDLTLSSLSARSLSANHLQLSLEAIAAMQEPAEQAESLLLIADRNARTPQPIPTEANIVLQQIAERYQNTND